MNKRQNIELNAIKNIIGSSKAALSPIILFFLLVPILINTSGFNFPNKDKRYNRDGTGERFEGFYDFDRNPKEFNFKFRSAKVIYQYKKSDKIQQYSFALFPPQFQSNLQIVISELETGYYMSPIRTSFKKSKDIFSWDADFVNKNKIRLESLRCFVELSDTELFLDGTFLPILLSYNGYIPAEFEGYEFIFYSNKDTTTKITIYNEGDEKVFMMQNKICPRNIEMIFPWKPEKAKIGNYYLHINPEIVGKSENLSTLYIYKFYNSREIK